MSKKVKPMADPREVAEELMGTVAKWANAEVGWTCQEPHELQSTIELAWHCEDPDLCDEATHRTCARQGYCEKHDHLHLRKEFLAKCRKVEYRQVRTVMEI